ncbi:FkbM family methyltransferase [Planctomicrobium sp. SH661]|uniref:FkbM family methyltransferase n=1 Tax=Planctomicrobium sp. SH661 TaxID=3448124 RepID=UPI003F5C554A
MKLAKKVWRKIASRGPVLALAGAYFDLFQREFHVDDLAFTIPYDKTTKAFRGRFALGIYEPSEIAFAQKYITPESSILDLGGCIGVVSCVANRQLSDRRRHVVVEANPKLMSSIEANRDRNGCGFQIESCLVSRSSDGVFYLHELIVGGSADRQTAERVQVPVKTVEQLSAAHGIQFDSLMMDIEGGELGFIRENEEFFKTLRIAIIEFHDFIIGKADVSECRNLLRRYGLAKVDEDGGVEVWKRG